MQGDVRLDLAGQGFGVDFSAYYAPREDLGIGLTYRSLTTINFDGNANFTTPDAFASCNEWRPARSTTCPSSTSWACPAGTRSVILAISIT